MKRNLTNTLALMALLTLFGATAQADLYRTIAIDGDTSDWAGVPVAFSDANDNVAGVDWKDVYFANDADYLYVRFTLWSAANAMTFNSNYYIDGDNDDSTGYNVFGSPDFGSSMFIQSGVAYQEAAGGFNEGSLAPSSVSFSGSGTDYEFRVARNAVGVAGPFNGQALFVGDSIQLQLQTDLGGNDLATDGISGIGYTFATVPEPSSFAFALIASSFMLARRKR